MKFVEPVPDVYPWPPVAPDITTSDIELVYSPFAVSPNGQLHRIQGCPSTVYKSGGSQKEFDLSKAAKDCAITPRARVFLGADKGKVVHLTGFIMNLATPFVPKSILPQKRRALAQSIVQVVQKLYDKGIVHGDIKLENMLINGDGEVRLRDFAEARYVDEDEDDWEGSFTLPYVSAHRWREQVELDW